MNSIRDMAIRVVSELDAARAVSSKDSPVDEFGIIEAALVDAMDEERSLAKAALREDHDAFVAMYKSFDGQENSQKWKAYVALRIKALQAILGQPVSII